MHNNTVSIRRLLKPVIVSICFLCSISYGFKGSADVILTIKNAYRTQKEFHSIIKDNLLSPKYPEIIHGMMPVRFQAGISKDVAIQLLQSDNRIEYIETDFIVYLSEIPNDPYFDRQWSLYNPDNNRADIKALEAWNLHTGIKDVIVTILDTGLNYKHPDLIPNIWINADEIPDNSKDDDHNGFIDDIYGWNFAEDNNDPMDRNFHGTHVAGIIGAYANNSIGIAGIMHHVSIMGVKGIFDWGWGFTSDLIAGIYYAVDNGADIINASWGGGGFQHAMEEALAYAGENNVIFVAAAGNYKWDNDENPFYPASYPGPNIISVGASTQQDSVAWFSHYGKNSVDLFAPGTGIFSTALGTDYRYGTGTSMSAPHVVGTIGLLISADPYMSYKKYIDILLGAVEPKENMKGLCVTGGRLDAYKALKKIQPSMDMRKKMAVIYNLLNNNNE